MSGEKDASNDPFARVAASAAGAHPSAAPASGGEAGTPVAPAPGDAPKPSFRHARHGEPRSPPWVYRDAAGGVLGYVVRFDREGGEKDVLPLTLWRTPRGRLEWKWKAHPAPRALYGLDRLAARPDAPVLAAEGEKAADAAGERFPGFVAITWPGGCKAVAKADFSPLHGRRVVVWPDADDPGRQAARAVAKAATTAGAASVAVVELPAFLPKGWDLADDWPAAFAAGDAAELLTGAPAAAQIAATDGATEHGATTAGVDWPPGIRMEPGVGLFHDERRDGNVTPHWLSAPFEVLSEARAANGNAWSVVVRFRNRDGAERTMPIPRSALASGGGDARAELADAGLVFNTAQGKTAKLTEALMRVRCDRRITLVSSTGWCGERFALPERTIGPPGAEDVLFTGDARSLNYGTAGTAQGWREGVAAQAEGNSAATFALCAGFAAPLLRVLGGEGGGFHFRGHSSTGKSTLLVLAGSIWGGSQGEHGFGHTWRTTANALESLALAHNDTLLCLDEFAQIDPAAAGEAAYMLASGQGKGRSKTDGARRKPAEWLLLFLSSGETSLADHMASSAKGGRAAAGQELRLVDIAADAGAGMGIWETEDAARSPAQRSEAVKAAARAHYGHAGPAFLGQLTSDRVVAVQIARGIVAGFLRQAEKMGDTGQVRRVAQRFALIAAAGELATTWGVAPWEAGAASKAALALYHRWAEAFGRDAPREERDVLRRLRDVIASERSAFAPLGDGDTHDDALPSEGGRDGEARALRTYGYRRVRGPEVQYLLSPSGWGYVFAGFDKKDAARIVRDAGFLEVDTGENRFQKRISIRSVKERFYCVSATILDADLGD